jgi:hypothetical protein
MENIPRFSHIREKISNSHGSKAHELDNRHRIVTKANAHVNSWVTGQWTRKKKGGYKAFL